MNFGKVLVNPFFTTFLAIASISLIITLIVSPDIRNAVSEAFLKPKDTLQSSLLPENYTSPTPTSITIETQDGLTSSINTERELANTINKKPSSTKVPIEKPSSTVSGRDLDRVLITELIANSISEYNFYYDKFPVLYSNKSEVLLKDKESDTVYFYNQKENKINAMAISLIEDTYLIKEVSNCSNNFSKDNQINISLNVDTKKLILCKEDKSEEAYILF